MTGCSSPNAWPAAPSELSAPTYVRISDEKEKLTWMAKFHAAYTGETLRFSRGLIRGQVEFIKDVHREKNRGFLRISEKTQFFRKITDQEVWAIEDAYVEPEYRGRGVFSGLLRYAISHKNVCLIHVNADNAMKFRIFFKEHGFGYLFPPSQDGLVWLASSEIFGGHI